MRLLRQLFSLEPELIRVARAQNDVIHELKDELYDQRLTYARNTRDLIQNFLVVQEDGIDVTEELRQGHADLADEVARLEEHAQ